MWNADVFGGSTIASPPLPPVGRCNWPLGRYVHFVLVNTAKRGKARQWTIRTFPEATICTR